MSMSRVFIERPVMTVLLTIWVVGLGLFALLRLPVSSLPQIEFPVIQVVARLPGATPEIMAQSVALPLEQKFSGIPGLESMVSTSAQGITQINLQFSLTTSINAAAQDVGSAISGAQALLPTGMPSLPTYAKINPAEQPIIYLAVSSDTMPLYKVHDYADNILATRLSMLPNVAQVELIGAQKYAVRIYAKPEQLTARNMTITELEGLVSKSNINAASGFLQGPSQSFILDPNAGLQNAKEFSEVMLREKEGLRLKDVATVVDDVENTLTSAWHNGKRAIVLAVSRQPGSNTIEVARTVQNILPELRKQIPESVSLNVIVDRSESIQHSVHEVGFTFFLTLFLVIFVIYLFLRNLKATMIPSVTLPISIVITFALMYALGFSVNNLTLLALTLSLGFIIDDAIVVQENIAHYQEKGENPKDAALKGAKEIGFTIVSMTLSLAAVFLPILWLPGIVGRLFYEFAVTIVLVVMTSGVVSLTLTPMMCRFLMDLHVTKKENKLHALMRISFEKLEALYEKSLRWALPHGRKIRWFSVLMLVLNIGAYMAIPKGFFPNEDTGLIYGVAEATPDASFDAMQRAALKIAKVLKEHSAIREYNLSIGVSTTTIAQNQGRFFIVLKDLGKRSQSISEVMKDLRKGFDDISELQISMQAIQNLRTGSVLSKGQYQYTLQAQDLADLNKWSPIIEERLKREPGFLDVSSDLQSNSLQLKLDINRDRAAQLGINAEDIARTIQSAFSEKQISNIYTSANIYEVILTMEKSQAQTIQDLEKLYFRNNKGELIPLSSIANPIRQNAPLTVGHLNRLASATISFNLEPGFALGQAINRISDVEKELNIPPTLFTSYQGTAAAYKNSQGGQIWLLVAAIATIYIILGVLYESYIHPLTILTGLPSAGLGALLALMLLGMELDTIGVIGIVVLIGIVKKNAIMMIDYALHKQREDDMSPDKAIFEACLRRFRPIMMTTFAAIAGALPIALWMGAGAEFRRPLGVCIIGGLLVSQWLTLYITPAFYMGFESWRRKKLLANDQELNPVKRV